MVDKKIILVGAGGHASACIDLLESLNHYSIAGLVANQSELNNVKFGYAVNGTDDDIPELAKKYTYALVAIGQIESPLNRIRVFDLLVNAGFILPTIISPNSYVSPHAIIDSGSVVMPGAIVGPGAVIGKNCIINSRALIEHDALVEDHTHVSTGAILNGSVKVGSGSFIGSGTVIKEGVVIQNQCMIGMGLLIKDNISFGQKITGKNESK